MNGAFGDMGSLLKQAQQMQRELDRVREELKTRTVEGTAGGGAVRVTASGDRTVVKVELSAELHKSTRELVSYSLDNIDPDKHIRLHLIEASPRILPALPVSPMCQVE